MRIYGTDLVEARAFGSPLTLLRRDGTDIWTSRPQTIPRLTSMSTIPVGWVKLWDDGFAGGSLDPSKWEVSTVNAASSYSTDRVAMTATDYGPACELTAVCTDGNLDTTRGGGKIWTLPSMDLIRPPVYVAVWLQRNVVWGSKISVWTKSFERDITTQTGRGWLEIDVLETGKEGGLRNPRNVPYESPVGTEWTHPGLHIWQWKQGGTSGEQIHVKPDGWRLADRWRSLDLVTEPFRLGLLLQSGSGYADKRFTYYQDDVAKGDGDVTVFSDTMLAHSGESLRDLAAALWEQPTQLIISAECLFGGISEGKQWLSAEFLNDYMANTQGLRPDPIDYPVQVPVYRVEIWVPPGDSRLPI